MSWIAKYIQSCNRLLQYSLLNLHIVCPKILIINDIKLVVPRHCTSNLNTLFSIHHRTLSGYNHRVHPMEQHVNIIPIVNLTRQSIRSFKHDLRTISNAAATLYCNTSLGYMFQYK